MKNQTIDGVRVRRPLLEKLVEPGCESSVTDAEWEELRALLDAEKDEYVPDGILRAVEHGAQVDAIGILKQAARPQGEPVAWIYKDRVYASGIGHVWREKIEREAPDSESFYIKEVIPVYAEQSAPLKIGHGVTVKNIGFGSEEDRKPYLVFSDNGNLTEVNLIDVSLVSKRRVYTVRELGEIGVQVEQPAPVAAKHTMKTIMEAVERSSEYTVLTSN